MICFGGHQGAEMIYCIMSRSGHIKIGYVKQNLFRRFRLIQVGNPHPVTLIGLQAGDRKREAEVHRQLAKWRYRGEWFHQSTEVWAFVGGGFDQSFRDEIDRCFHVTLDDSDRVFDFERANPAAYDRHPMRTWG